jgi:AcrR family transcriptional regulator
MTAGDPEAAKPSPDASAAPVAGQPDGTARRRRSRAEQQAETRSRLLDAAAEAFAAHGFVGASIDHITDLAGYTRGAFYSNFSDKAELLIELSQARMADFALTALPEILAADEADRLGQAARWLVDEPPALEVLLLVELARLRDDNAEVADLLDRFMDRSLTFVDGVLDASPAELPPSGDPERAALTKALLASVVGMQLLRHLGVEVDARTAEQLLGGLLGPDGPATNADLDAAATNTGPDGPATNADSDAGAGR